MSERQRKTDTRDELLVALAKGIAALMDEHGRATIANPHHLNAQVMKLVELQGRLQGACTIFEGELKR